MTVAVLVTVAVRNQTLNAGRQAADSWQNVEFLEGVSAEDLDVFMRAMNVSLGVGCEYCHETGAWNLDTLPEKETARSMMRMIAQLSQSGFEALELPTCWTCHRGSAVPPPRPNPSGSQDGLPEAFVMTGEPALDVYQNVQTLGNLPARELATVMATYTSSLGVDCEYCHVPGEWSGDEKITKLLARRMHEIQTELNSRHFGGRDAVSCWTCHRGAPLPEMAVPAGLLIDPNPRE